MAPATGTAATTVATLAPTAINPQSQNFGGDEFSNNLFSDLAPLLTLFGEQVTKQFLTMSMGWSDNVLLAMGPLGIITIVVSAIRVGGVRRLKALVGRARESKATAEQELLSSTSDSVCELWSGKEIVRQLGQPKTKEMVLFRDVRSGLRVHDLVGAVREGVVYDFNQPPGLSREYVLAGVNTLSSQAPNIALNVAKSTASKAELWIWATVGAFLQSVALVFPALTTYVWKFSKASSHIQGYAYPSFLVGTLTVILGTVLCSHVIEGVTVERTFSPRKTSHQEIQVFRLQKACRVSDQTFSPYLILNAPGNDVIRTSRLRVAESAFFSKLAGAASVLTVAGYVCQFVGLRGLHWSATVVQLGITLFMAGVRSWVRRGLAIEPPHIALNSGYELDEAAIFLGLFDPSDNDDILSFKPTSGSTNGWWEIVTGRYRTSGQDPTPLPKWVRPSRLYQGQQLRKLGGGGRGSDHSVVTIRYQLQLLMPDDSPVHKIASAQIALARTMEGIMIAFDEALLSQTITTTQTFRSHRQVQWSHLVSCPRKSNLSASELFEISLICISDVKSWSNQNNEGKGKWKAPKELYSILSLWIHSLNTRNVAETVTYWRRDNYGDEYRTQHASDYMRVVDRCDNLDIGSLRVLPSWIGRWLLLCGEPDGQSEYLSPVRHRRHVPPEWPVFGYDTLVDHRDTDSSRGMSYNSHRYDDLTGALIYAHWTYEDGRIQVRSKLRETCVAIISHQTMVTQCALEILSGFMNAVASEIQSLGGITELKPASGASSAQGFNVLEFTDRSGSGGAMHLEDYYKYDGDRWTNSVLLSFSQIMVDTGLVSNLTEANAIVIPPFARRGLLPTEEGNVTFEPPPPESRTTSENPIEETSPISSHQSGPPVDGNGIEIETSLTGQKNTENGETHGKNSEPRVAVTEVVGREGAESSFNEDSNNEH